MIISNMKPKSVQFSPVTQSCPTLCDPMDCSMPGLPVHQLLPDFLYNPNSSMLNLKIKFIV